MQFQTLGTRIRSDENSWASLSWTGSLPFGDCNTFHLHMFIDFSSLAFVVKSVCIPYVVYCTIKQLCFDAALNLVTSLKTPYLHVCRRLHFLARCKVNFVIYRVSGLEVYKNTCFYFSTWKLYEIYFFNSVQSNSKRFLCTSVHFNVGTFCSSTDI